jgi:hypothetical protein
MSESAATDSDRLSMLELINELERIRDAFRENLDNLRSKLAFLDAQPELQTTLQDYRKDADEKANSLEAEVTRLREELKSVRDLLGLNLEKRNLKK